MNDHTEKHLDHLDGLRGVAVLAVVFGHFWANDNLWPHFSSAGVDLFFVISGRLMAEILFVRRVPLSSFFVRRFSRVFPALVAYVVLTAIAFAGATNSSGVTEVVLALTTAINYAMIFGVETTFLDHFWSLCVEEHSYIILAAIAFYSRYRTQNVALVLGAVGLAALINGVVRVDLLGENILRTRWRTDVSLSGIFLSATFWLYFKPRALARWVSPVAFAVAIFFRLQTPALLNSGVSMVALAVAIVSLDQSALLLRRALSFQPLRVVGLLSFSLYLWQQPFYKLNMFSNWSMSVSILCVCVCTAISYFLIERPIRRSINDSFDNFAPGNRSFSFR